MRIYLDTSVYNRPFDDQTQPRIWLEGQAFSVILTLLEQGDVELATSSVVSYETSRNPHAQRRAWVDRVTRLATARQQVTAEVTNRAKELEQSGLKSLDALHVAAAETAKAEYFITGDDRLIRRYQAVAYKKLLILDPIEFVRHVTGKELE